MVKTFYLEDFLLLYFGKYSNSGFNLLFLVINNFFLIRITNFVHQRRWSVFDLKVRMRMSPFYWL